MRNKRVTAGNALPPRPIRPRRMSTRLAADVAADHPGCEELAVVWLEKGRKGSAQWSLASRRRLRAYRWRCWFIASGSERVRSVATFANFRENFGRSYARARYRCGRLPERGPGSQQ